MNDKDIIDQLRYEYSILQNKIDCYGDYSFKIKSIIIPIACGAIVFIVKERSLIVSILTLAAVVAFLYYETINNLHKAVLSSRALYVERALLYSRLRYKYILSPRIAHTLIAKNNITVGKIARSIFKEWKTNIIYYVLILTIIGLAIWVIASIAAATIILIIVIKLSFILWLTYKYMT